MNISEVMPNGNVRVVVPIRLRKTVQGRVITVAENVRTVQNQTPLLAAIGCGLAYPNMRKNHQYLLAYGMKKLGGGSWAEARRVCGITDNFRIPRSKRPTHSRMQMIQLKLF